MGRRDLLQAVGGAAALGIGATAAHRALHGPATVVGEVGELESVFADLQPNQTVYIDGANAPYRTTEWLDIDVDGVTVVGPGVADLVVPADGADVGGFRIGSRRPCRNVGIYGVGFDGNPEGQSAGSVRLHGVVARNVTGLTLAGNRIRRTHPASHGDGGCGITVNRSCTDVQVVGNRITATGDQGIEVAGRNVRIAGNVVRDCVAQAVSCDVWDYGTDYTPRSVVVSGNVLGNIAEGSLTGVSRNEPPEGPQTPISITGNVGFGFHKSFCHVRGTEPLANVSIQDNASVQETDGLETPETTNFSGVTVSCPVRNLAVRTNTLVGYSGRGVNLRSRVTNAAVQANTLESPGQAGIRVAAGSHGQVTDNTVVDAGLAGIRLQDAGDVAVTGNHVREPGRDGILLEGDPARADHEVTDNFVVAPPAGHAGIALAAGGVSVRGNTIRRNEGVGIREPATVDDNVYRANHADGDDPWEMASPTARVRGHTPPVDVHRDLAPDRAEGEITVAFDRRYAHPPQLSFGRRAGAIQDASLRTDADGAYVGATVSVADAEGPLDVFVNGL